MPVVAIRQLSGRVLSMAACPLTCNYLYYSLSRAIIGAGFCARVVALLFEPFLQSQTRVTHPPTDPEESLHASHDDEDIFKALLMQKKPARIVGFFLLALFRHGSCEMAGSGHDAHAARQTTV